MNDEQSPPLFQVDQIDHVELCVPDRHQAAQWYIETLGLRKLPQYDEWADDPAGPLMIGTACGNTKLALFQGQPAGSQAGIGFHLVAFRVGASSFLQFVASLPRLDLKDHQGRAVDAGLVTDHQRAFSVYFTDPFGNQLEITTYEHQTTRLKLAEL